MKYEDWRKIICLQMNVQCICQCLEIAKMAASRPKRGQNWIQFRSPCFLQKSWIVGRNDNFRSVQATCVASKPNRESKILPWEHSPSASILWYTVKKRSRVSRLQPGLSLTKLPLARNNSVMTSLFPPRESLVVTSRLGTGNSRTFFYGVCTGPMIL
jgi:hypothetical protein